MNEGNKETAALAQKTLQANTDHLRALEEYTQRLEIELENFDKLLEAVEAVDDSDLDLGYTITIPGSIKATAPISTKELLSSESPFRDDALKRTRYKKLSEVRPMKPKELEVLAEAVQAECYRKHALNIQQRGSLALSNTGSQIVHTLGVDDDGIDWERVAEKVSNVYMITRTARECEIRWCGEQHPDFNREPWTQEEVQKVKSLVADFTDRRPDWVSIAKELGVTRRTPLDCMQRATLRKPHRWTTDADERLLKAIGIYGHENWHLVAQYVSEDATPSQCSSRFQKTLDESIKRSPWTPEEDARLSAAVAAYGSSWVDVATKVPGRHNDQCRERWTDHLDPDVNKSPWSKEEDGTLIEYVYEHKDAPWKQVAEHLGNGRTGTMCRNRYAALQNSGHVVPVTPTINSERCVSADQGAASPRFASTSSKTLSFKSYRPHLHTTPTAPETENGRSNSLVFLEPVVNPNPESHKHHSPHTSQYKPRFKTATTRDMSPPNTTTVPPSKKRRTRSRTPRSPLTET